jgi:UDP-N-acetylglucosamine 2-epimerase (non-hydrolysing)/GDP/UDP-N,N'-diacetylbacillosamine 2-epimerase (hydrolysing)
MKKVIAVFTGNRAEYGLQMPILRAIDMHPELDYRLIVSGAHLDQNFGNTLNEIKLDGFHIDAEIKINLIGGQLASTAQAIGHGIIEISQALMNIKPDIVMVYADRFEGFAAIIAASQMNIPTAHIEGGDLTEGGALDDSVRHAMTKLAHLHFTTNDQATNRILAMGEESWRVHTVGLPSIDLIAQQQYADKIELTEKLGISFDRPIAIFTQHSVTTEFKYSGAQVKQSLIALESLAKNGCQIIATYPNNDVGGNEIIEILKNYENHKTLNLQVHKSLGRHIYHGLLALAKDPLVRIACIGNSSSGIKETPAFGCPAINIGSRQKGRLRASNVLDVSYNSVEILTAAKRCFFDDKFRNICRVSGNPYWKSGAGNKIAEILASTELNLDLTRKRMMLEGKKEGDWFK